MTMPDITGLQLAEKIRPMNSKIPILICSGLIHQIHSDKINALQPFAVIAKPIVREEIAAAIRKLMAESKPR
jgi:CheY-like chemotaxis protein